MAKMQEFKCPCCGGSIEFDSSAQKMKCPFCDTEFDVKALSEHAKAVEEEQPEEEEEEEEKKKKKPAKSSGKGFWTKVREKLATIANDDRIFEEDEEENDNSPKNRRI